LRPPDPWWARSCVRADQGTRRRQREQGAIPSTAAGTQGASSTGEIDRSIPAGVRGDRPPDFATDGANTALLVAFFFRFFPLGSTGCEEGVLITAIHFPRRWSKRRPEDRSQFGRQALDFPLPAEPPQCLTHSGSLKAGIQTDAKNVHPGAAGACISFSPSFRPKTVIHPPKKQRMQDNPPQNGRIMAFDESRGDLQKGGFGRRFLIINLSIKRG